MKNILTIFRRDFTAFYTSPIGYIFMIVFLLISVGLYMTTFFTFPVADMRGYFSNLPILLCIFIPAVTMRVWAEERKENTWEMLLTFPMRARELVLGKFLATLAFFFLTLVATLTVPVMLNALGQPDNGAILAAYLGTFLLGAFFLSIGIFFSGFCRDQIVAFVVTLLVCFAIFLLGTDFVAAQLDSFFSGFGTFMSNAMGVLIHYTSFTRGVIEVVDVLYFVAWTLLFLILNMMYIEGRSRPGVKITFGSAVLLCVLIGLAFNRLLAGESFGRYDMTENKIYTVSPATRTVLSQLPAPVQVKLYITPKDEMPTAYTRLEQDVIDKLDEMRLASSGKMDIQTIHLRAANVVGKAPSMMEEEEKEEEPKDEAKAIEERMLDKGVAPFQVQALDADQVTQKLVYSSIGIGYRDKKEEIIPQVLPQTLSELEYRLLSVIYKLTREKDPVVALVAPQDMVPPEMRQIYAQMGQPIPQTVDPYKMATQWLQQEKFDVRRVDLTKDSPLPEEYDALVVITPRGFDERQRYEINRAVVSGKPVLLAVQQYNWDYRINRNQMSITKTDLNPGINELLEQYGLSVSKDVLMDVNHTPINVSSGMGGIAELLGLGQSVNLPTHILVTGESMNPDASITNWLTTVYYLWGTAIKPDESKLKELGLEHMVLMNSTQRAWVVPADASQDQLNQALNDALQGKEPTQGSQYPLMAMVSGQFPDTFKDKARPEWAPSQPNPAMPPKPETDDTEETPITPAPGKLILMGCGEAFSDNFMQNPNNRDLLLNSVDALTLGDDLINVRAKKPVDRVIARPEAGARRLWKTVNYAAVNLLIVAIGIGVAVYRRKSRMSYTMMEYAANRRNG